MVHNYLCRWHAYLVFLSRCSFLQLDTKGGSPRILWAQPNPWGSLPPFTEWPWDFRMRILKGEQWLYEPNHCFNGGLPELFLSLFRLEPRCSFLQLETNGGFPPQPSVSFVLRLPSPQVGYKRIASSVLRAQALRDAARGAQGRGVSLGA